MNRENNLVVEKLSRLTFSYVLFDTKVTCDPGVEAANSRALRTYLHTFLLYPTMFGCMKEKLGVQNKLSLSQILHQDISVSILKIMTHKKFAGVGTHCRFVRWHQQLPFS